MEDGSPAIIDLYAEAGKLTMFQGRTPQTKVSDRRGSAARLGSYRDGILFLSKSAGTGHWETHPEDELVYLLDGAATLDFVADDEPQSLAVRAGMIAIVPQGVWHRFHSTDGRTGFSAVVPGDHIDADVDDPRPALSRLRKDQGTPLGRGDKRRRPTVVDLNAEIAKLTGSRRTSEATAADRKGSVAPLASYRDGLLLAIRASGIDRWERHPTGDELIHVLDGSATLEVVCDAGPPKSFPLRTGVIAIIPQGVWHRVSSSEDVTRMALTPYPGETIGLDVDDPRTVAPYAVEERRLRAEG